MAAPLAWRELLGALLMHACVRFKAFRGVLRACEQDIPEVVKHCRAPGPLHASALTGEELQLLDAMMARLHRCAEAAAAVRPQPHEISAQQGLMPIRVHMDVSGICQHSLFVRTIRLSVDMIAL
jgi:hypothetical protein